MKRAAPFSRVIGLLAVAALGGGRVGAAAPPGVEDLANLAFHGIYEHPVTLRGGLYEGEPFVPGGASRPRVALVGELLATGDLDGDGAADAAILLAENAGGSGVHVYLAVVRRHAGGLENVATRLIGDRLQVRSLAVARGAVSLEFVAAGPNEPACCPTRKVRRTYRLEKDTLVETAAETLGALAPSDLAGVTWRLAALDRHAPVPAGIAITALFEAGRVSGSAGCNRYFANLGTPAPGRLVVSGIGATRAACPGPVMAAERRYLTLLPKVRRFGFSAGRLALSYREGDDWGTMLFEPGP